MNLLSNSSSPCIILYSIYQSPWTGPEEPQIEACVRRLLETMQPSKLPLPEQGRHMQASMEFFSDNDDDDL